MTEEEVNKVIDEEIKKALMYNERFKEQAENEIEEAFQTVGIVIRARINDLGNQERFYEAGEIQKAYDIINKYFYNKLTFKPK